MARGEDDRHEQVETPAKGVGARVACASARGGDGGTLPRRRFPREAGTTQSSTDHDGQPAAGETVQSFREEWERTSLARLVAAQLLEYRVEHELTQRALAERLCVEQQLVAELEAGDRNPDLSTLARVARELELEFLIDT